MKKLNRSLGAGLWVVLAGLLSSSDVVAQSNVCVTAPTGMISSWRGESNALDSVGGLHGEVSGDVSHGAGVVGGAFHFGGVNGKVIVSNAPSLNFGPDQDFSIEAWIAPQVASTSFGVMDIVDKRLSPSLTECLGYEFNLGDGRLHCRLSDSLSGNGLSFGPAGPDLRDGYFHHVALTIARNSSTGGKLYVDGQVVLTFDTTGLGDFSNDQPLRIGHSSASSFFNGNFKGVIDEVSIYSRSLAGADVAAIYQAGSAGKCNLGENPSCIPAPFGAIGWWKGDGNAVDHAGLNTGVMMNGGGYAAGKVSGGFQFDGNNQSVQIPYSPSLISSNFTVEGWIRPDAQVSDPINQEVIFGQGYGALQMVVRKGTSGLLVAWQFGTDHFNFHGVQSTVEIPIGQFTHLAGTWDGATLRLFINGVLNAQSSPGASPVDSGCDFSIGGFYNPAANICQYVGQFFNGTVDEIALYNRALSGSEIGSIFLADSDGKCPPVEGCVSAPSQLAGLWKGDENGFDSRGLNHGTLVGGIGFTQAVVSAGFNFDGIDDGVVVPNSPALNVGANEELTIEAWIRPLLSATDFDVMTIVDKRLSPNLTQCLGYEFNLGGGRIHCRLSDSLAGNGLTAGPAGPDLRDGRFHHVALTLARNSISGGKLFVDGQVVAVFDTTGLGDFSNSEPFRIGNHSASFFNGYFKGQIDEMSVYKRALTAGEVAAIFNAGSFGKCVEPEVPFLINVDYGAGTSGTTKTGVAATGFSTNDFWNFYTRDGAGGWLTFGYLTGLKLVDGTVTSAGMTVANGPGMWGNGSVDPMYFSYIYPFDSGNLVVTFTNLPSGRYDVLPYCFDGNYELTVGGTSYGIRTTREYPVVNPPVWTEGVQYARFTNVVVQSGQPLVLTVRPGIDGYAVLSGVQLLRTSINVPVAPFITKQPTGSTVYVGTSALFSVTALGDAPLYYQWLHNGTNLPSKTTSNLALANVQLSDAGGYSVVITNFAGAVTSQIAQLMVKLPPPCSPPALGLVSHWRFENNLLDTWGENHGITSGRGAFFDAGKSGRALWANTAMPVVPDHPSLDMTNAFTLEAWVRPTTFSITTPQTILAKFENITSVPLGMQSSFYFGLTNNGTPFLLVSASGSVRTNVNLVAPVRIPANAWTHLGATYDGTSLRLYTNGVLVASSSYSGGVFASTTDLTIGGLSGGLSRTFNGLLDEVAIYNRALNESEILTAYQSDFTGKCVVGPEITANPLSQAVPEGEDVQFAVSASGTKPFQYQWSFNGTNIFRATNAALVLEKVGPAHAGFYSVVVSNSAGFAASTSAQLKVLPAPSCVVAPEGLIGWWPMDGNPTDVVGMNVSIAGGISYPTGKVGRAMTSTLSGGRVWLPQPASSLNFGTNQSFSFELWVKASSGNNPPVNPSSMPFMTILEKRSSPFNGIGYMMGLWNGRLAFALGSTVVSQTNSSMVRAAGPDLRDDMFHHLAVTVQRGATNGGTLFVDGKAVAVFDTSIPRNGSSSGSFYIGAPALPYYDASPLFGMIDELAIYNRALSAAEIEAISAAGAAGKCKLPPSIITQPVDQTVKVSSNAVFSVLATGTPALRYRWWKGNQPLTSTNPMLVLSNVQVSTAGAYRVVITNGFGAVTSSIANLVVQQLVPPAGGGQMRLEAAGGQPVIRFTGVPGQLYTVQASTNLVDWVNIGIASDLGDGTFEFTDPNGQAHDALFYRVIGP